jgi:hypothetical protein
MSKQLLVLLHEKSQPLTDPGSQMPSPKGHVRNELLPGHVDAEPTFPNSRSQAPSVPDPVKSDYTFFTRGALLQDPNSADVLVIDHAPPKGFNQVGKPLAYLFKGGLPKADHGENRLFNAIAKQRAILTIAGQKGAFAEARRLIEKAGLAKPAINTSQGEVAKSLLNALAYDEATLRRRGWNGPVPTVAPEHSWEALSDHELGYPKQLGTSEHTRRWGRYLGRHKLYWKGMWTTFNRPEEQGSKGGRTLWTSLPATLLVGGLVAGLAITAAILSEHHKDKQDATS